MTYEEAARIAKEIAKQPDWAEKHIQDPWGYELAKQCHCSLCYWRRSHIEKILREERDEINHLNSLNPLLLK